MPLSEDRIASPSSSRFCTSSEVSNDTTSSTPDLRQLASSSSSQSPPRGRAETASLPAHGPSTQCNSVYITFLQRLVVRLLLFNLPLQQVYIDAACAENS